MANSTLEYRQLLQGLDRQNRQPAPPPKPRSRARARARAMYPGGMRTRSMEPLGSIDEIVMEGDFSDSAVSPPPLHRRRPSTPGSKNFSRPDPANPSPRLSHEKETFDDEKRPVSYRTQTDLPLRNRHDDRGIQQNHIQAMSAFHGGDPLPDEPVIDLDLDSEGETFETPPASPIRSQAYRNDQRYIHSSNGAAAAGSKTVSVAAGRRSTDSGRRSMDREAPSRPLAINKTPALPLASSSSSSARFKANVTQRLDDYDQSAQPRQVPRILKRISVDQRSERFSPPAFYHDLPGPHLATTINGDGRTRPQPSERQQAKEIHHHKSDSTKSSKSGRSSNKSASKSNSKSSSRSDINDDVAADDERPPCWAGSDFDFMSVLSQEKIAKLKKKGINPALYAEMQAAKKGGQQGAPKSKKWIGPLVGNTYAG